MGIGDTRYAQFAPKWKHLSSFLGLFLAACQGPVRITAPASMPKIFIEKNIEVDFLSESSPPRRFVYRSGDETATVIYARTPFLNYATDLKVSVRGARTYDRQFSDMSPMRFDFVSIPGVKRPLIDLELYSGGAHCCFSDAYVEAAASAADTYSANRDWLDYPAKWKRVGLDKHYALLDVNGTGYDFGAFGGSTGPVMVYDWRAHELVDRSMFYPYLLQQDARQHIAEYNLEAQRGTTGEAALVSYLADEYRLGRANEGWRRVRQLYQGRVDGTPHNFEMRARQWLAAQHLDQTPPPRSPAVSN